MPTTTMIGLDLDFNVAENPAAVKASGAPVFIDEPIFESIPGMSGHHAATITAFPEGELYAAWYSYPGQSELAGSAIYSARKRPGDTVWTTPQLLVDGPRADGNPVLYSEGDNVWLFQAVVPFGWSTGHIEFQTSTDRGQTWSVPRRVANTIGSNTRFPPVRLADGTLLLPAYDDLFFRSLFFASRDGRDWSFGAAIASTPGNIQPSIVQLSGGRLLAVMRNTGKGFLWVMASDDGGRTWSTPRDSGFPNPGSAAMIMGLASGNLVLIYNDSPTDRRPLAIALSGDEGRTWPYKKILADGDLTYSYPSAVQTPDGLIHIVYTYGRQRIQHAVLNEAWIVSDNTNGI